jgi:hypothetical protein
MDHLLQMNATTTATALASQIKPEPVYKKYRVDPTVYDHYDTMYATQLAEIFQRNIEIDAQESFNLMTENLMEDKQIRRCCLLDAIRDYERANGCDRLHVSFTDAAFNYRPYQPCVIS